MNMIRMNEGLSEDAMRNIAPSIFASAPHGNTSERYVYLPTIDIVRAMIQENFHPMEVRQSRSKDATRRDFTRHMIRFRRPDLKAKQVGDTLPEVVLVNAHDGSSSYQLSAGLFRLVCSNGMMVADAMFESVRIKHTGDALKQVIEGSYRVIDGAVKALDAPKKWAAIPLTEKERLNFAEGAHYYRFAKEKEGGELVVDTPITPQQLLIPRRSEDNTSDLWTTFNVIQENLIRGGLSATRLDPSVRRGRRRVTTRAVTGIDQDMKLNKALWLIAQKFAELKGA